MLPPIGIKQVCKIRNTDWGWVFGQLYGLPLEGSCEILDLKDLDVLDICQIQIMFRKNSKD